MYEHADDEVPYGALTGDALFIGDVGRPDLLASIGVTADELGRMLYHSVQHKLMGLPDAVRVFPAHGAGSACGKNLSTERQSTIGEQRAFNYACQPMTEEEFLAVVTEGQPAAPAYFVFNATLNRQEREVRDTDATVPALSDAEVEAALAGGASRPRRPRGPRVRRRPPAWLDQRARRRADGRDRRDGVRPDQQVVVIAPEGQEQEVATRFARIGYDHVLGYLPEPEAYFLAHEDRVRARAG